MQLPIPHTPPHVSINRMQIIDLPGVTMDPEVRGRQAHDLLSSRAIIDYARAQAAELAMPDEFVLDSAHTRIELPRYVERALRSTHPQIRQAAESIARRLGRNLGHILLTLLRGDPVNRRARPDWTDSDWDHWERMERIWLGGGLMSGSLGELVIKHGRAFLDETGYRQRCQVSLTPYRGAMTLLGGGRYLPISAQHAVCLDCGHTLVKRACLCFSAGRLDELQRFPSLAVDWSALGEPGRPDPARGSKVLAFVADAISSAWQESRASGLQPGIDVMLCVAAYVDGGRLLGNGIYAQMSSLADDLRPLLADEVQARTGERVRVHLIHDGTAAAALHAGEQRSAVIIVGTALGVGFPPAGDSGLRSLSPDIRP